MSAVRKGESPQKTDVFVGAFIPNASVPRRKVRSRYATHTIPLTGSNDHTNKATTE